MTAHDAAPATGERWISLDPVIELLKAGRIVGLSPRQLLGQALRDLLAEQTERNPA